MDLNDLYNLNVSDIRKSAARALSTGKIVDQTADYLRQNAKDLSRVWSGGDSDATKTTLNQHAERLETAGQAIRKAHKIFDQLAQALDREHQGVKAYVDSVNRNAAENLEGYYTISISTGDVKGGPGTTDAGANAVKSAYKDYVNRATAADTQAASAVAGIDELDRAQEAANSYRDLGGNAWDADAEDASEALGIYGRSANGKLTQAEIARLRELLKENKHDREFADKVLSTLKPQGFLTAYADVAAEKGGLTKEFQQDTAALLATATDLASGQQSPYTDEFKKLMSQEFYFQDGDGRTRVTRGDFVLAPLLQLGGYETNFKTEVSGEIYENYRKPDFRAPYFFHTSFNAISRELSNIPMNAVLHGLANDPEAATKFLGTNLNGADDRVKYLYDHTDGDGRIPKNQANLNPEVVGMAFEAASTGYDFDDPYQTKDHSVIKPHTAMQAAVTAGVINAVGKDPQPLQENTAQAGKFRNSMSNIAANYMVDIHNGLQDANDELTHFTLSPNGTPVDFGKFDLSGRAPLNQFLQMLGHDQSSREKLGAISKVLAAQELKKAMDYKRRENTQRTNALTPHFRALGLLHSGKLEFEAANPDEVDKSTILDKELAKTHTEFENANSTNTRNYWIRTGVKIGAGLVIGLAVPGGPLISGATGSVAGEFTGQGIDAATKGWDVDTQEILDRKDVASLKNEAPGLQLEFDDIVGFVERNGGSMPRATLKDDALNTLIWKTFGPIVVRHNR